MGFMANHSSNFRSSGVSRNTVPRKDKTRDRFHIEPETFSEFKVTNGCLLITHKRFIQKYVAPFFSAVFNDFKGAAIKPNDLTGAPELVLAFDPSLGQDKSVPGDESKFNALEPINKVQGKDTNSQISAYNAFSDKNNNSAYKLTRQAEDILSDYIYTDSDFEPNYYVGMDKLYIEIPNNFGQITNTRYSINCAVKGISIELLCRSIFGGSTKSDGIIDYEVSFFRSQMTMDRKSANHILSINRCNRNVVKELIEDIGVSVPVPGGYDFIS